MRCLKLPVTLVSRGLFFGILALFLGTGLLATPKLTPLSVQSAVRSKFTQKLLHDYPYAITSDVSIRFNTFEAFNVPTLAVSMRFEFAEFSNVLGKTVIPLTYLDANGQDLVSIRLGTETTLYAFFVKSTALLRKGEIVRPEHLERVRLEVNGRDPQSYHDTESIVGKMVRGTIAQGTVFTDRMLKIPPVINMGADVLFVLPNQGFTVEVQGKALDEGAIGDIIRVQSAADNRKILRGKVKDEKTVIFYKL